MYTLSAPIKRSSHFGQTVVDALVVVFLPLPNSVDKLLTAEIASGQAMLTKDHIFYNILGADACMVAARKPQGGFALHSAPSNHKILDHP